MKKITLIALSLCLNIAYAQDTHVLWTKAYGNETNNESPRAIAVDNFNQVITTGYYRDAVDFDPGESVLELTSNGSRDIYIQKFNENGSLAWATSIGGTGSDIPHTLTIDELGYIYIGGGFGETVDFDPGAGEDIRTSAGYTDAFLLKLDPNGNFEWVKTFGAGINDYYEKIEIGTDGNLYATGAFEETIDIEDGPGITILSSVDAGDIFIAKFNTDGDLFWANSIGSDNFDYSNGLAIDSEGNVIISGSFVHDMDADPSDDVFILEADGFNQNYIIKYNNSGEFLWGLSFGDDEYYNGNNDLEVDSEDNIYAIGRYYGSSDFNPGPGTQILTAIGEEYNNYLLKLNSDGNFIMVKSIGNSTGEVTMPEMEFDANNDLYFTGYFTTTVDFEIGGGSTELTSNGEYDYFILKMNDAYELIWAESMGGIGYDLGYELAVNPAGHIYTAGIFNDVVDFNPNEGVDEFTSNGAGDVFIQKIVSAYASIGEFKAVELFPVYPNPTNGKITIELKESAQLTLRDVSGKIISEITAGQNPLFIFEIPGEKGIYFLEIRTEGAIQTQKIVKN